MELNIMKIPEFLIFIYYDLGLFEYEVLSKYVSQLIAKLLTFKPKMANFAL